jgi:hypothetical protein
MHAITAQHVLSRCAFNEACNTVDPHVTTAGLMPILQAHADYNNMTPVINIFKKITSHLVIFVDQPMYSWAKELIWADPERFDNVIVMYILFNFSKLLVSLLNVLVSMTYGLMLVCMHKIVLQL